MPNQNAQDISRDTFISNFLNKKGLKFSGNNSKNNLKVDSKGRVKALTADAVNFVQLHFNIKLKEGDSIFNIIPDLYLEGFLYHFRETLAGIISTTLVKSGNNGDTLIFRKKLEQSLEENLVEILLFSPLELEKYGKSVVTENHLEDAKKLNESSQIFESLFNNHPDAIYTFDLQGNFITANDSACNMAEISYSELIKHSFLPLIPKKDKQKVLLHFLNAVKGEFQNYNTSMRSFKGTNIMINITNFPIINNGAITGVFGIAKDITTSLKNEKALVKLNSELETRANELAISNAELEQFAYIASHDLQEPLRMVSSFLTQLNKKYKDQLDLKAQQYIYFATDGANRMRNILLDLLEYSRVGKLTYKPKQIDLNILIGDIIGLHKNLIQEANGKIEFKDLPIINAAEIPLQRVLSNLITNALKYQKVGTKAVIKIEAVERKDFWQINVIDNGIGIENQFFEKIFIAFQRLHSKDHFSGTGIGLAICKKIIENHGGEIWVTSKLNEGSNFHFTIKKQI